MYVFISHSSKNAEVANKICEYIEERGKKCFIAPRDIQSGKEYAEEILDGIDDSETMILIMSEKANHSPHVLREVERAVSKSIPILVYKIEEVELTKSMEYFLMTHQWSEAKFPEDYSKIWEFVCGDRGEGYKSMKASNEKGNTKTKKMFFAILLIALILLMLAAGVGYACWKYSGEVQESFGDCCEVGDTVTFGSYLGEPIEWRILKISEDGTEAVLIAKNILTMKAFDAAESGTYNQDGDEEYWVHGSLSDTDWEIQRRVRGNNDWSVSNIRTWLNSSDEVVMYADQPPMITAMSEKTNGYNNEAGFLYGFTAEEKAAILVTDHVTNGNALTEGAIATKDKVYLLSEEELGWFDEAGISMLAIPTAAALEQDTSEWYAVSVDEFGVEEYVWWLREPVENTTSKCHLVGNGYTEENVQEANVGLEGYGIRPAVTVNLQAECWKEKNAD
uniref:DUF6273 domain-containing protein n=1 Tax=Acetatifactor sp. TaxID=1872090 RepID=UPI004056A201